MRNRTLFNRLSAGSSASLAPKLEGRHGPTQMTDYRSGASCRETSHLWEGGGLRGRSYIETGNPCCVVWGVWLGNPPSQPVEGSPGQTTQTTQQGFPVFV